MKTMNLAAPKPLILGEKENSGSPKVAGKGSDSYPYSATPKKLSCFLGVTFFFSQRYEVRGFLYPGVGDRANQPRLNSQLPQ